MAASAPKIIEAVLGIERCVRMDVLYFDSRNPEKEKEFGFYRAETIG